MIWILGFFVIGVSLAVVLILSCCVVTARAERWEQPRALHLPVEPLIGDTGDAGQLKSTPAVILVS
jgi:hypothetical protein